MGLSLRAWLLLLSISAIGLLLRLHFASEPLWVDELHTAWCVDASYSHIASRAGQGNQTPLFFWLSGIVVSIVGSGPFGFRLISLACGAFAIWLSGRLVLRETGNTTAATATAVLVACDSWLLFYSSEARPYAMLQFLALLQFISFYSLIFSEKPPSNFNPKLALLTLALLATHLTSVLLIATECLLLVYLCRPRSNVHVLGAFLSITAGVVAAIPFALLSLSALENRSQWFISSGVAELYSGWKNALLYQLIPAMIIALIYRNRWKESPQHNHWQKHWMFGCWAMIPLILAIAMHYCSMPVASYRYTTVASLAPAICLGLAIARLSPNGLATACTIVIVVTNLAVNPVVQSTIKSSEVPAFRTENWQSVVKYLNQLEGNDEQPIFLLSNLYEDARSNIDTSDEFQEYLKFPVSGIYKLPKTARVTPLPTLVSNRITEQHVREIALHRSAIFVCRVDETLLDQIIHEIETALSRSGLVFEIRKMNQRGNSLKIIMVQSP